MVDFQVSNAQIFFITDAIDENLNLSTNFKALLSSCGNEHTRENLCCKMNSELELFVSHLPSWACHFDDDNYVNVMMLEKKLKEFNPKFDWYLGKPSVAEPIFVHNSYEKVGFQFATGGAGFCLSQSLLIKMRTYLRNSGFELLGNYLGLPDDVTLGYLIEHLLNVKLTVIDEFHSHLEPLNISLSGGSYDSDGKNLIDVPLKFSSATDPHRFRSIHCYITGRNCV
ncbi:unnamed protein product [Dracunculus medinensis]|uniref:Fringe glycosyltransferase n=1 Tax=Dracunculus medinensis TaxID=318479 RepID=A0A0N4U9R2_DRAME|nr:unnamed protein product [Dracunculus medinensis]